MSGCDYLASPAGVGLKTAWKYLLDYGDAGNAISVLRQQGSFRLPADYEIGFQQAEETFLYQLVWDPVRKQIVPLTPYPEDIDPVRLHHAGPSMTPEKAEGIVSGRLDPLTGRPLQLTRPVTLTEAGAGGSSCKFDPLLKYVYSGKQDTAVPALQKNTLDRYIAKDTPSPPQLFDSDKTMPANLAALNSTRQPSASGCAAFCHACCSHSLPSFISFFLSPFLLCFFFSSAVIVKPFAFSL